MIKNGISGLDGPTPKGTPVGSSAFPGRTIKGSYRDSTSAELNRSGGRNGREEFHLILGYGPSNRNSAFVSGSEGWHLERVLGSGRDRRLRVENAAKTIHAFMRSAIARKDNRERERITRRAAAKARKQAKAAARRARMHFGSGLDGSIEAEAISGGDAKLAGDAIPGGDAITVDKQMKLAMKMTPVLL